MNILKKIVLVNKVTKAIKEVKEAIEFANTHDIANKISSAVNKVKAGLSELKDLVPNAEEAIKIILDAIK